MEASPIIADAESPTALVRAHLKAMLCVSLIGLVLRLALFAAGPTLDISRATYPDSPRYIELAENMVRYGTFGRAAENSGVMHIGFNAIREERGELPPRDANGLRPEIFRTPGYPLVIAATIAAHLPLASVLLIQCVLGSLAIALLYLITLRLTGSWRVAAVSAMLLAIHPADILHCNALLSESLFTTLMLTGIACLVLSKEAALVPVIVTGLILGAAVLVRPAGVLLGPCLALWLIVWMRSWKSLPLAIALIVSSLALPIAWMARNRAAGEGFMLSSVPTLSSLYYTAAYSHIIEHGGETTEDWPREVNIIHALLRADIQPNESVFAAANALARNRVAQNRAGYIEAMKRSAIKFTTDHSAGALWQTLGREYKPSGLRDRLLHGEGFGELLSSPATIVSTAWALLNVALFALSCVGILLLVWRGRITVALLLVGVFLYFLLTTQVSGLERFRVPVIGLQAIAAASILLIRRNATDAKPRDDGPNASASPHATSI